MDFAGGSPGTLQNNKHDSSGYLTKNPLNRQSLFRRHKEYITNCLCSNRALILLFKNAIPLMRVRQKPSQSEYFLHTLTFAEVKSVIPNFGNDLENPLTIFLGTGNSSFQEDESESQTNSVVDSDCENGYFWFAVAATEVTLPDYMEEFFRKQSNVVNFAPYNLLRLGSVELSIAGQAKSILHWHSLHVFCSACGKKTEVQNAGHERLCVNQACLSRKDNDHTFFPRIEPAVLMVITSPDKKKVLLGRKKRFQKNLYSCLGGFIEPGETVEDAVRREVLEESGITVGKVVYKNSLPWPFPSALILCCYGEALTEKITIATDELEDVRWFDKEDVKNALTGNSNIILPPRPQQAHQLLKQWTEQHCQSIVESRL